MLTAIGAAIAVTIVWPIATSCWEAEEREFVAIAHVEGRELEPEGHPDADSCVAYFETSQSAESVIEHYRDELGDAGWADLDISESSVETPRGDRVSGVDLTARNEAMLFSVYARSYPDSEMTRVTVHVSDS